MKTWHMLTLVVFQAILITLILIWIIPNERHLRHYPELFREESSDGEFVLLVEEMGNSYNNSYTDLRVSLCENADGISKYIATMDVGVHVGNKPVKIETVWNCEEVQIDILGMQLFRCILPLEFDK